MDSSEQSPQPQAAPAEASEETPEQQVTPPLYEYFNPQTDAAAFQSEPPQPEATPTADAQQPEGAPPLDQAALEQAVRQGLIYPPPPSYYENFQPPNEQIGFSAAMSSAPPARPYYPPPRPVYPPPNPAVRNGTARRPRAWVWIVVVALSVGLVGCGLLSWGAYTIFSTAYQSASGSIQVVEDFYGNLQSQDYPAAYHDLDMPNLTLAQFTQQAQQADQQNGAVQSYQLQQPSVNVSQNAPDLSHFSYTVTVTRTNASYSAIIDVSQDGKSWKITNFDRI